MCSKHVEALNKAYCKTKFCASSSLNTVINYTHLFTSGMLHGQPTITSSRVSTTLLPARQKFYLDDIFMGYFMTHATTMGNLEGVVVTGTF